MLLSNNDIKRGLLNAKQLAIHPLKVENIKGSSINLTASKCAWNLKDNNSAYVVERNKIVIPPNNSVCIVTNEAIWISRRIAGTYHSRVTLVSKGFANISTTLDPQWYGLSLVTLNNLSSSEVEIPVGSSIASIMLYFLKTPATKGIIENQASRPEIYTKFNTTQEEEDFLTAEWHKSYNNLVNSMLSSLSYENLYKDRTKFRRSFSTFLGHNLVATLAGGLIATVVGSIILYFLGMK